MKTKTIAAWCAAGRYVLLAVLAAFSGWLQQVGKAGWESLTSYDVVFVSCALGISALTALGAVMNGRWSEAKEEVAERSALSHGGPEMSMETPGRATRS